MARVLHGSLVGPRTFPGGTVRDCPVFSDDARSVWPEDLKHDRLALVIAQRLVLWEGRTGWVRTADLRVWS